MTTTDESTTSTAQTIPDQWDLIPCVQYGFPDGKGPSRAPKLSTVFEPIPEGAHTAGPVYILSRKQYERQQQLDSGYQVAGEVNCIATELQHECEDDDRVLYPIHIESDVYHEEGPDTLNNWFRKFTEESLGVSSHFCTRYFSGRRSIHIHVPRFVSGEDQRERLKELAETFCTEKGAELDCRLYSANRMFRLPGVEHEKTGLRKVEIDSGWNHERIIREASGVDARTFQSYAEILRYVFTSDESLSTTSPDASLNDPLALFRVLDSDRTILEVETDEQDIETPLIEREQYPDDSVRAIRWLQYNAKEFSPYAFAEGHGRSVAALQVKGGAFSRKAKRDSATMIPAWFYGAVGGNGEFTKEREHAPLQLSQQDYKKWDFRPGDTVVIIGGRSRNSRILNVNRWQACIVGHALTGENGGRDAAHDYLEAEGYDTGGAGSSGSSTSRSHSSSTESNRIWPARENPRTTAEGLQRQAEQEGIETLTHPERIKVACRHLRQGWKPTWEWFKDQFGSEFKPEVTWKFLSDIAEDDKFSEYDQVEVPSKPV